MSFKPGDIACIKVSEENVMVLQVQENQLVSVRRPTMGNEGVRHFEETYFLFELETPSERRTRNLADQLEMQQRIMALQAAESPDGNPNLQVQ